MDHRSEDRRPVVIGAGPLLYLTLLMLVALLMAGLLVWSAWGLMTAPAPEPSEAVQLLS
jgi:hypothetical protein